MIRDWMHEWRIPHIQGVYDIILRSSDSLAKDPYRVS